MASSSLSCARRTASISRLGEDGSFWAIKVGTEAVKAARPNIIAQHIERFLFRSDMCVSKRQNKKDFTQFSRSGAIPTAIPAGGDGYILLDANNVVRYARRHAFR